MSRFFPRVVTGWGSQMRLIPLTPPALPSPYWVRIRPILSGICGSDLGVLTGENSPYLSAYASFPFVPGHEIVGTVIETGSSVTRTKAGDRVVIEPVLGCITRGFIDLCTACLEGRKGNCERVTMGNLESGLLTGYCRTTGGGWSAELVVHETQAHIVPDEIPDEVAVLTEPLSCVVHGVFQSRVPKDGQVLVIGCGTIGLLTIAALREYGPPCTIIAVAKHPNQADLANRIGANYVIPTNLGGYSDFANLTGATLHQIPLDKPVVTGGVDATFDCVGSNSSLSDGFRWTRPRGTVTLLGLPGYRRVDLAPLWYKELRLIGSYCSCVESLPGGKTGDSFALALQLLTARKWSQNLSGLVRHRYSLGQYRQAIQASLRTGRSGAIKVVFDLK
jgi:threonine dehydrogenase-like Zn-dependent dehydrogenase